MQAAGPMQVEKVLDDLIARLSKSGSTADVRAALIEARRLRNVTMRWAAIPPPPDARREMLSRVMDLVAKAGPAAGSIPPIATSSAPPRASSEPAPRDEDAKRRVPTAPQSRPRSVSPPPTSPPPASPTVTPRDRPSKNAEASRQSTPFRTEQGSMTRPRPLKEPAALKSLSELPALDDVAPTSPRPGGKSPFAPAEPGERRSTSSERRLPEKQRVTAPPPASHDDLAAAERYKRKVDTLAYGYEPTSEELTDPRIPAPPPLATAPTQLDLAAATSSMPPAKRGQSPAPRDAPADGDDPFALPPPPRSVRGPQRTHTIAGIAEANEALASVGIQRSETPGPKRKISSASLDVQQLTSATRQSYPPSPVSVKPRSPITAKPPPVDIVGPASGPPSGGALPGHRSLTPNPGAPPPLRKSNQPRGTLMMGSAAKVVEDARAAAAAKSNEGGADELELELDAALSSASRREKLPPYASTPSPGAVRAVQAPREGAVEGFSSAVSAPAMAAARSPKATPTIVGTPVPPGTSNRSPTDPAHKPLRTVVAPGITIVRPDASQWQPHPVAAGVTIKLLYRDPRSGVYTALVRLAPGASLPRRRHAAAEEALLVSGIATIGSHEMRAGEYCRAESETIHELVTTSTGCTFFLCGSEHDEFLDGA